MGGKREHKKARIQMFLEIVLVKMDLHEVFEFFFFFFAFLRHFGHYFDGFDRFALFGRRMQVITRLSSLPRSRPQHQFKKRG